MSTTTQTTSSDPFYTLVAGLLFLLGSAIDTVTTYIGLSKGFHEQTEFVVYLMSVFGVMPGLLISKALAGGAIILLSVLSPRSVFMGRFLAAAGGLLFTIAGVWNVILIWG